MHPPSQKMADDPGASPGGLRHELRALVNSVDATPGTRATGSSCCAATPRHQPSSACTLVQPRQTHAIRLATSDVRSPGPLSRHQITQPGAQTAMRGQSSLVVDLDRQLYRYSQNSLLAVPVKPYPRWCAAQATGLRPETFPLRPSSISRRLQRGRGRDRFGGRKSVPVPLYAPIFSCAHDASLSKMPRSSPAPRQQCYSREARVRNRLSVPMLRFM